MKLKFWDRLVLFIGALISGVIGVFVIILGCQWDSVVLSAEGESFFTLRRMLVLLAGLLVGLYAVYVLLLPRKFRGRKNAFVVQQTDNGELRIAVKAIENLVQKCIDMHSEIHVVSMSVENARDGVRVDLCISLANNISIPLAVASLQKQIKQYLAASSGIDVKEVRVSVETAANDVIDSPYIVENNVPNADEVQETLPQEKPKKLSMHQRLFSHEKEKKEEAVTENVNAEPVAEQAKTPAPVSEAPEAEENDASVEAPKEESNE